MKKTTQQKAAMHLSICLALLAAILFFINGAREKRQSAPPEVHMVREATDWNLTEELEGRQHLFYESLTETK